MTIQRGPTPRLRWAFKIPKGLAVRSDRVLAWPLWLPAQAPPGPQPFPGRDPPPESGRGPRRLGPDGGRDDRRPGPGLRPRANRPGEPGRATSDSVLTGTVTDVDGRPLGAVEMRLFQDRREVARDRSKPNGSYSLYFMASARAHALTATLGQLGTRRLDLQPTSRETTLDLQLKPVPNISGRAAREGRRTARPE